MAERYVDNMALLLKMETTYGTDPTPTGLLNAMIFSEVTYEPLLGNDESRDRIKPYMGHQGVILTGEYVRLTASFEMTGSGTAGTAPAFGPLLRCCGLKETVTAGTDVKYTPISKTFESATFYFNDDGVNHVVLGARGTLTWELSPSKIPRFRITLTGLFGSIADLGLPTIDDTKFKDPVPVNKANTVISLHGFTGAIEGMTFDLGNAIEPRLLINQESIRQTARQMTGNAVVEAASLAEKNWIQIARSHTLGTLSVQHGSVAGNIVQIAAPAVQVGRPSHGVSQKIRNYSVPLMFKPTTAGNDEVVLTFR